MIDGPSNVRSSGFGLMLYYIIWKEKLYVHVTIFHRMRLKILRLIFPLYICFVAALILSA